MLAARKIPIKMRPKLAKTDIQNLLSWAAPNNALKVGPGRNPLNCSSPGRVKRNVAAEIHKMKKIANPMISYFHPKSRLP